MLLPFGVRPHSSSTPGRAGERPRSSGRELCRSYGPQRAVWPVVVVFLFSGQRQRLGGPQALELLVAQELVHEPGKTLRVAVLPRGAMCNVRRLDQTTLEPWRRRCVWTSTASRTLRRGACCTHHACRRERRRGQGPGRQGSEPAVGRALP